MSERRDFNPAAMGTFSAMRRCRDVSQSPGLKPVIFEMQMLNPIQRISSKKLTFDNLKRSLGCRPSHDGSDEDFLMRARVQSFG